MQRGLLHNSIFKFWVASFTGLGDGMMLVVLQGHAVPGNECEQFQLGGRGMQTDRIRELSKS